MPMLMLARIASARARHLIALHDPRPAPAPRPRFAHAAAPRALIRALQTAPVPPDVRSVARMVRRRRGVRHEDDVG
jgi:hypothetical protein